MADPASRRVVASAGIRELVHARDLTEMMRLHGDYVQAQMKTLAEQASEMGQIVSRTAMDATRARH